MIRIGIAGAAGRMGKAIFNLAAGDKTFKVTSAFEHASCKVIGKDIGEIHGSGKTKVILGKDPLETAKKADVVIDFTLPQALDRNLQAAVQAKTGIVIGTTGISAKQMKAIQAASKKIPIVQSPNMSIGVNLLFRLTELASKALDEDYDIEIFEAHHRMKKDAPSGTAMKLLEIASNARKKNLTKNTLYGRKGEVGARKRGEIGMMALRGGDVVGDHTVFYLSDYERIELTHRASSRTVFAQGALKAAKFIARRKSGLYNMQQVLGIV